MKNPQGKNFKTVIFNHEDKAYKYTFKVTDTQFLKKFNEGDVDFLLHYDEPDNTIDVFTGKFGINLSFVYRRQIK
jgi:hypothetical protein